MSRGEIPVRTRPRPSDYTFYFVYERNFVMDNFKEKTPENSGRNSLEIETTYTIKDNTFIVEPVFKEDSKNTVGSLLMWLMQSDSEKA